MNGFGFSEAAEAGDYVVRRGGRRLLGQGRFARRCCEWAAEEWPGPDAGKVGAVLRRRAQEEYGFAVAAFLVPILVNLIAHLIVEWWKKKHPTTTLTRFD